MEYMERLATPRGEAAEAVIAHLSALQDAVSARMGRDAERRSGFVAPAIVENMKEFLLALAPHLRSNFPHSIRLFLLAACCGNDLHLVEIAEALGVNRNALTKAKALRTQVAERGDFSFAPRANGGVRRRLSASKRRHIWDFWLENTRASPMRADNAHKVRAKDFDGKQLAEPTVKHMQSISDRAMYDMYKADFGDPGVSLRTFCKVGYCKPGWVRRMPLHQRLVCLSTKDMIAQRMVASVRENLRKAFPNGVPARCRCCPAGAPGCVANISNTAEFLHRFAHRMLCPLQAGASFPDMACAHGSCLKWGWAKNLGRCPHLYTEAPATWRTYKTNSETTQLEEVTEKGTMTDFMTKLQEAMEMWVPFDFTGRWQSKAFKVRPRSIHAAACAAAD